MKKSNRRIVCLFFLIVFILIIGCKAETPSEDIPEETVDPNIYYQEMTEEGLTRTAEKFGREWEQKDFSEMYHIFIPELKSRKSQADFIDVMNYLEKDTDLTVRLDRISLENQELGYAYFSVSSSIFEAKAPAIEFRYLDGAWLVDAFARYFQMDLENKRIYDKYIGFIEELLVIDEDFGWNYEFCEGFEQNRIDLENLGMEVAVMHSKIKVSESPFANIYELTIASILGVLELIPEADGACFSYYPGERKAHEVKYGKKLGVLIEKLTLLEKELLDLGGVYLTEKEKAELHELT